MQPNRGIIFVDTSFLYAINAYISEPVRAPDAPIRHMLDTFVFLSQNGFKICIPEMVACESAGILKSGVWLNKYFPKTNYEEGFEINKSGSRELDLKYFLLAVSRGEIPNIEILAGDGPKKVKEYLNELNEAVRYRKSIARIAIMNRTGSDKRNFGDMALEYEIEKYLAHDKSKTPIIVFSDDEPFLRKICPMVYKEGRDGYVVSAHEYVRALARTRLHEKMGFLSTVTPDELQKYCIMWGEINHSNSARNRPLIDTSMKTGAETNLKQNDYSFRDVLSEMECNPELVPIERSVNTYVPIPGAFR